MPNRLSGETSPYLRQHEDNPVDWYPWGDDAFTLARALDRPVILSVGYSACHWCHVMAHESFEDDATAELMNQWFVNIKVDREERPDVDALYMEAVQAMTGQGGWPMTMFLTPDGRPFFGGTYFPKTPHHGRPSFTQLLAAVHEAWVERRDGVEAQADEVAAHLAGTADLDGLVQRMGIDLDAVTTVDGDGVSRIEAAPLLQLAVEQLLRAHDREWGGFGRAPKFPQTTAVDLLLRAHAHGADPSVLDAVVTTLDAMASGGMYDHLGGGFARYSTDDRWLVPHFEKMLYDQAALLRAYTRGYQVTGLDRYRQVVDESVTYVLRDLLQPDGGFSSAEDADSEGEEGRFYVWSLDEVREVLGDDLAARAAAHWGITERGNFEGHNILHLPERGAFTRDDDLERARALLLARRARRVRPGLDDKVLTEWNAMLIASLAEAAATFGRSEWGASAERAARFLLDNLRTPGGRWLRAWHARSGARLLAYGADLAHLVDAFTRLHEATGRSEWIGHARDAASQLLDLFVDHEQGGVFTVGRDAEQLLVRQRDLFDSATPSASSTAAVALLRLAALTGEERFSAVAERILQAMGPVMAGRPTGFTNALCALDLLASGTTEIAVSGDPGTDDTLALVRTVHGRFLPNAVLTWGEPFPSPLWEGRTGPGPARAYVCRDFTCAAPALDPATLDGVLDDAG